MIFIKFETDKLEKPITKEKKNNGTLSQTLRPS